MVEEQTSMSKSIVAPEVLHQPTSENILPILPLKNIVVLPTSIIPIIVGRQTSVKAVEHALKHNNKTIFILMSTALSIDWVCMVYATHLSDPFVAMSSLFITLAFGGFIKQYLQSRDLVNLLSAGLLLFSILTLFFFYKVGVSRYVLYGILLGATAGIAFFLYIIFSDMLTKRAQLDTMQLMATRFWILFLGSSLFLSKIDLYQAILISGIPLILVSFGACIVPNFFNQQAIKKLGPIRSSILISFVPPIAYIFDACYNEKLNLLNLIVCLIITSALILPKLLIPLQKAKVPMESNL